jgi:hypothetical protein
MGDARATATSLHADGPFDAATGDQVPCDGFNIQISLLSDHPCGRNSSPPKRWTLPSGSVAIEFMNRSEGQGRFTKGRPWAIIPVGVRPSFAPGIAAYATRARSLDSGSEDA